MAPKKTAFKKRAPARKGSVRTAGARARKAPATKSAPRARKGKLVYDFSEGSKDMKDLLGGKGANLAEMMNIGLPVPPGFTITTEACRAYMRTGDVPDGLLGETERHLKAMEREMGRKLGDPDDPLLVSVRSGAKFSMPGMMDTVLNLGLNDQSVHGLARQAENDRFAFDSYRRFIQMFGRIVMGAPGDKFEEAIDQVKALRNVQADTDLTAIDLKELVEEFRRIVKEETGREFPQDPREQLRYAIRAVFDSWNGDRARLYRKQEKISDDLGTAVNIVAERLIDRTEAIRRVTPEQVDQLLHPQVDENARDLTEIGKGMNASPGAAVGVAVFDSDRSEARANAGEKVILVRRETNPDDLNGMIAAQGILTSRGGKTSHAAVVARGMGKPCVCGADALDVDLNARRFAAGDVVVNEGDLISIDGTTGKVFLGEVPLKEPEVSGEFATILEWADKIRRLKVRANADTPEDARRAREFGAQGIGLARTEHMFLGDRRPLVEKLILAATEADEQAALEALLPLQREDFYGILAAMDGLPVTIRLLDPPLHEFLPDLVELSKEVAVAGRKVDPARANVLRAVERLHEQNPMLGMRGVRLGMMKPGLYNMQVRAIMEAACRLKGEGKHPGVEIMIPLVGIEEEIRRSRAEADRVAREVIKETKVKVKYLIGTMIEVPRATTIADKIAEHAEFFSFGTNDLTQMTFGFSRDDVAKILDVYVTHGLPKVDPFTTSDRDGVGSLLRLAVAKARTGRPGLHLGICGEHGGDPSSVEFCHELGLDYVSASPFRVPIARLAAAHAALGSVEAASK